MSRMRIDLSCLLTVAIGLIVGSLWGCGPSQDVLDRQEAQLQEMIQEAKTNPPNMTPEENEMRRHRLEMDFGEEAAKPE